MSRVQAELGELPVSFFSQSLRDARTGPYSSVSFIVSVRPAPQCQSEMLSSLRPCTRMEVKVVLDQWREDNRNHFDLFDRARFSEIS